MIIGKVSLIALLMITPLSAKNEYVRRYITPSLTHLYNKCIETGDWPGAWKKGELTPAFNGKVIDKAFRIQLSTNYYSYDYRQSYRTLTL
jgi:hypothetical protein